MEISVFSSAGKKSGTWSLPESLFGAPIRAGLMHQAVMRQQSSRRAPIAHAKSRGEVAGSTRKLYSQKHTGRARRGSIRSPLLRGGGKAFGPKRTRNFQKDMPREMRRQALLSCLSLQAKQGAILGLESFSETIKTKDAATLLKTMSIEPGRRVLFVLPQASETLVLSVRNLPRVETLLASSLNPEDVLSARHLIFVQGAIEKAEQVFGQKKSRSSKSSRSSKTDTKGTSSNKQTSPSS